MPLRFEGPRQRLTQFANLAHDDVGGFLADLFEAADEGTSHDDPIRRVAEFLDVFRFADAKTDAQRQLRLRSQPGELFGEFRWNLGPFARDADHADAVK